MAKRLHRSTPATENHVIQSWEVANAAARLAIVPAASDLGRVALQQDDGTLWSLRSISPVEWRQLDPNEAEFSAPALAAKVAAEAAKVQAEAARDAAATAGATYVSTAAGIAAVGDGAYFYVPSGDTLIRYQRSGAAAVEVGRLPSGAAVSALQAALTPAATDTAAGHWYVADAVGRVIAYIDTTSGLRLAGIEGTVQNRVLAVDRAADAGGALWYVLDGYNRVVAYVDPAGELHLAGRTATVQAELAAAERTDLLVKEARVHTSLPTNYKPGDSLFVGSERFLCAGQAKELRPNQTRWTTYTFQWSSEQLVAPTAVKRRRATIGSTTWSTEDLTFPAGSWGAFFTTRQFRDLSWLYDRAAGKYWYAVSGITSQADGWRASGFTIASSTDGLTIDFVADIPFPTGVLTTPRVWTPELFVEPDGQVYVVVTAQEYPAGKWSLYAFKCTNLQTFASWTYVGQLTGTALPHATVGGEISCYEPCLVRRDGVYTVMCNAAGTTQYVTTQLVVAHATSLLGPYDIGHGLVTPTAATGGAAVGTAMLGEGPSIVEMPPGSAYRWALIFDNFQGLYWNGQYQRQMVAYTNDFVTLTDPVPFGLTTYDRHCTYVIGL